MNNQMAQCDDRQLMAMIENEDAVPADALTAHVENCPHCRARLQDLAGSGDDWQRAAKALASEPSEHSTADLDREWSARPSLAPWDQRSMQWTEALTQPLLDPPSHPELLGRLGRYDIEKLIGYGGMGVVFKAFDSELNRTVAIKLLSPQLAANDLARQRFAREASAAAGIVDDHVMPIHNVETNLNTPFLVMKYVAGGSLQQRIERKEPVDTAEVLRIGMQIAKGLAAAHAQGLIHRDVKPSNILLDEGVERAVLTDFGLVRMEGDGGLTRTGFQPGTPNYMSPEQVRGQAIDVRSDLFSLGCVLYALCTGHPPFRADTNYAVLRRITDIAPSSICQANPAIPDWLGRIVMRLLSKSADERYQSASQVAGLLEDCLAHVRQPAVAALPLGVQPTSGHRSLRRISLFALALPLLVVGIACALIAITSPGEPTVPNERQSTRNPRPAGESPAAAAAPMEWNSIDTQLDQFDKDLSDFEAEVARSRTANN